MKKTIIFLSFIVWSASAMAQDEPKQVQRYIYEVKYQLDSMDANKLTTENFFLDVSADGKSRFTSEGKLAMDSVAKYWEAQLAAGAKSVSIDKRNMAATKYNFVIVKDGSKNISYRERVGGTNYYYDEDISKIKWNILNGFEDYQGMKTQKATTNYGGRVWNVLFTSEIPLMEGPYKFKNLPGFVVKAWDSRNHYTFSFLQSIKVNVPFDTKLPSKSLNITKAQLAKAINNYNNKPLEGITNVRNANGDVVPVGVSDMEKRRQERLKKENNWIELL